MWHVVIVRYSSMNTIAIHPTHPTHISVDEQLTKPPRVDAWCNNTGATRGSNQLPWGIRALNGTQCPPRADFHCGELVQVYRRNVGQNHRVDRRKHDVPSRCAGTYVDIASASDPALDISTHAIDEFIRGHRAAFTSEAAIYDVAARTYDRRDEMMRGDRSPYSVDYLVDVLCFHLAGYALQRASGRFQHVNYVVPILCCFHFTGDHLDQILRHKHGDLMAIPVFFIVRGLDSAAFPINYRKSACNGQRCRAIVRAGGCYPYIPRVLQFFPL